MDPEEVDDLGVADTITELPESESKKALDTDYGIDLTETTPGERRKEGEKAKIEPPVKRTQNIFITAKSITINLGRTTVKATARVVVDGVENFDSLVGVSSYAIIAWSIQFFFASPPDKITGGILIGIGVLMAVAKHRITPGAWSKFLKMDSDEMKKVVKKRFVNMGNTFLGK